MSLGAFIAGAILGGSHRHTHHTERVVVKRGPNELIEYHKWLERKKQREEYEKVVKQHDEELYRRRHCALCGEKIGYRATQIVNKAYSFEDGVLVQVFCGCKDLDGIYQELLSINSGAIDADKKIYAAIGSLIDKHKKYEEIVCGKKEPTNSPT